MVRVQEVIDFLKTVPPDMEFCLADPHFGGKFDYIFELYDIEDGRKLREPINAILIRFPCVEDLE